MNDINPGLQVSNWNLEKLSSEQPHPHGNSAPNQKDGACDPTDRRAERRDACISVYPLGCLSLNGSASADQDEMCAQVALDVLKSAP